jgi:energy-coupling factor transport system ATP-binding protein
VSTISQNARKALKTSRYSDIIDKIIREMSGEKMRENIIEMTDVSFRYIEENPRLVLDNVSLTVQKGEWITIIGPNGSGKSTLTKAMNGLVIPISGQIVIDGTEMNSENLWAVRRKIGMVFQNPENQFVGATVEDDVAFGLENLGMPRDEMKVRVKDALDRVQMWDLADRQPANLSGGQKQRAAIAGTIASRPDIIVLDEATSMLDPLGRQIVFETIKEIKEEDDLTIISITHDINEALESDRIVVMEEGKIVTIGKPEEIFAYGEKLIELGLEMPFSETLKASLEKVGFPVPKEYLTDERMMEWLWTYNSKM